MVRFSCTSNLPCVSSVLRHTCLDLSRPLGAFRPRNDLNWGCRVLPLSAKVADKPGIVIGPREKLVV